MKAEVMTFAGLMTQPVIIQGGMGIGVSGWRLARAVSEAGHLGVVSGTALEIAFARRLQLGDIGGHLRRAMEAFPLRDVAKDILDKYFVEGGKPKEAPFKGVSLCTANPPKDLTHLIMAACFCEVRLAKEGHAGVVGINLLEKIRLTCIPALYGAMLAGVDYVLMGAGIPRRIPGVLDNLADGRTAELVMEVENAPVDTPPLVTSLNPADIFNGEAPKINRPKFLAIVGSHILATTLAKKSTGKVDGFIIETAPAGGHNSPPRSKQYTPDGEPIYGPKDEADLKVIAALGLPYWMAGAHSNADSLASAQAKGAVGVQIGTAFAFCEESDMGADLKKRVLAQSREGKAGVFTDPKASPTGFPFKVVRLPGTMYDTDVYQARTRICDIGHLRTPCMTPEGKIEYWCPAAPIDPYLRKGGKIEDTEGRKCLCNGLMATIGLGQRRPDGRVEQPILTAGQEVANIAQYAKPGRDSYTAAEVLEYVTGKAG